MIKKLFAFTKGYRKETFLTPTFVALECVMEILIPLLMANFVDKGIDAGDGKYAIKMGLVILLFIAIGLFFGIMSSRYSAISSTGFALNLRKAQYNKVQEFSFANIDKFSTASLVSRMTGDTTNLMMGYMMLTRMAVRAPLNMIISIVVAFTISARLAAVFVVAVPLLAFVILTLAKKAHPLFEKLFKKYDRLNAVVQENVRGVRVVKSFVRDKFENKKYTESTQDIYEANTKAERILSWNHPALQFCMYTCKLVVCYFGGRMIIGTSLTPGNLMSLISYAISCLMALNMLSMLWVQITMARAAGERVIEVLEEKVDLKNGSDPITEVKDGSIEFEDVSFGYYKGKDCLKNISISIPSGSVVGILGGTGSGKTSLAQLIPRLYDVTGGTLKVGGVDVRQYDIASLREQVAVVLQKNVLFSGTVRSNLMWGNENATEEQLEHACKLAQAYSFINELPDKFDAHVDQGGTNFSGGQRQRLCIARALLKKPKILILDDSTSAVDTQTDALIRKAFAEEIPDTTKLIIAQRISSVMDADIIMVIDNGALVDYGKHDELMERCSIYQEVYNSQQKGAGKIGG